MCTTMALGKNATADGSVIIAHADDDVADERFVYVPANQSPGSTRPVYYDDAALGHEMRVDPKDLDSKTYNASELYRYIGADRGDRYERTDEMCEQGLYESIAIGEIPQADETYAYFDSNYGVMNEKRLMIGECTCGAKVHPEPSPDRLFYAAELSRVALERCTNARDAIALMGDLIMDYGYYGTGETLLVGDDNEAWVMEMCGYTMDGTDGLWVAQRVPDNGYFVAANQFRIREIPETQDPDNLIFSENLHKVCCDLGWWNPAEGELDWAATVSYGEYSNPYYSLRRVWRALTKAKPSANLPAWVENGYTKAYPFSVVPDVKLDIAGVAAIYRDHYEGTEFDMTRGHGAGPWSDPTRYATNPDQGNTWELTVNKPQGAWERPISIYRCGMFGMNQSKARLGDAPTNGISWVGLERPALNCLMPFYCQVTDLPECVQTMNLMNFDLNSSWWVFNFVGNYATIKYSHMMQDIVAQQSNLEEAAYEMVRTYEGEADIGAITEYSTANAVGVRDSWWNLGKQLIVTYNDGNRTTKGAPMQGINYPEWWLDDAGYYKGPISYSKHECRTQNENTGRL